jgi:hypothetical protein
LESRRKLLDIFKALPEITSVTLSAEGDRVSLLRVGRSRFTLSSLSATRLPAQGIALCSTSCAERLPHHVRKLANWTARASARCGVLCDEGEGRSLVH